MPEVRRLIGLILVAALLPATVAQAEDGSGTLAGRVLRPDGAGIGGVTVVIRETGARRVTDAEGRYRFTGVPAGVYSLRFTLGERADLEEGVTVGPGAPGEWTSTLDWRIGFAETLVVTSVSRRPERIVDAPAAVSVATRLEIERGAPNGQLPKLLEFTPGVELLQTTLYDFNINTRGFGRTLNRRVALLVDGRDPSIPFVGSQEWGAASLPLDDVRSVELARGPSAALVGANASNGVINVTTRGPRGSEGGLLRLAAGELATTHTDLRYAAGLGGEWYVKVLGGFRKSDTFTVSRRGAAEYAVPCGGSVTRDCLPQEGFPLQADEVEILSGSLRFDKHVGDRLALTLEGGSSAVDGVTFQSNIGRLQFLAVDRPWLRLAASHPRWSVQLAHNRRDAPRQFALASGLNLASDSENTQIEGQGNWQWGSARLVAGGSWREEKVDSFDPARGAQSLLFEPVTTRAAAVFGQLDWHLGDRLKLVLAGRWDDSDTFYDDELSPKAALVYSFDADHTLRLAYNRGFQAPNYVQAFLALDAAAPLDLRAFEAFCAPAGVSCGFAPGPTRRLAVGNPGLGVEEVTAFEIGYSGIFGGLYLSLDYYNADNRDFFTDLLPTHGSPFGDFNTAFGPYRPPAGLPADAAGALLAALESALGPAFVFLSNASDGTPILALASYTVAGEVDTQGVDVGLRYSASRRWGAFANYSWFDFEIRDDVPGLEGVLAPNTPESSVRAGVSYAGERFDFALNGRWVDGFRWITGPFVGDVESYVTFDLSAAYRLSERFAVGVNVSNVFDEEHWENFGGDLIGRRALGYLTLTW